MPPGVRGFQKGHKHGPKPGEDRAAGKHDNRAKSLLLKALCADRAEDVLKYWVSVMNNAEEETANRLKASQMIIERAFGKPAQAVSLEDTEGGPAKIVVEVVTK